MDSFSGMAPWYDDLYAARGKSYDEEAGIVASYVRSDCGVTDRRPSVIDFGCGTAEHLRVLSASFEVVGVDASPMMLAIAREKLPAGRFFEGDMTAYRLGERFDLVMSLFSTVGYLPDDDALRRAIKTMAMHVRDDGVVIVEPALFPERVEPAQRQVTRVERGGATLERITTAERVDDVLRIRFELSFIRGDDVDHAVETHSIRLFPRSSYERAFGAAGLDVTYDEPGRPAHGLFIGRPV